LCVSRGICASPPEYLDYAAVLTLPPAPENSAGRKIVEATAHLLHKRAVPSVPVVPVARPYSKRSAQVYQGLLQEKDNGFIGKRSTAVSLEADESNADYDIIGEREASRYPYKTVLAAHTLGKRQVYTYGKRQVAYGKRKRSVPSDYVSFLGKREAVAYPYKMAQTELTSYRHHQRDADVAFWGKKRDAPTTMEAE